MIKGMHLHAYQNYNSYVLEDIIFKTILATLSQNKINGSVFTTICMKPIYKRVGQLTVYQLQGEYTSQKKMLNWQLEFI